MEHVRHGGDLIAEVLVDEGVRFLFTLCGGHISPILVGAKRAGIRVVDVRHEVNAVFAADAVARLSGTPGVAAVTAGPGVTNTLTAVKNAELAQSPLVVFGGATATALKGRGALQDIDQMSLIAPHVKRAFQATRVKDLAPMVRAAFEVARRGTPGPVFIEVPVDVLYPEELVASWYLEKQPTTTMGDKILSRYLKGHVAHLFADKDEAIPARVDVVVATADPVRLARAGQKLADAQRPLLIVGSQAVVEASHVDAIRRAVEEMGVPVYLSGMARGLLGVGHPLHLRHARKAALKEADVVMLAGVPCDFRLDYGAHIRRSSFFISANRRTADMMKNRIPSLTLHGDVGATLVGLARETRGHVRDDGWLSTLRVRDDARDAEIARDATKPSDLVSPLAICQAIEQVMDDDAIMVADGGDFVGTASYIVRPRAPLSWLDPGVFGTLGVGAGFAMGAKALHPGREVWVFYGDGSVGYSLAEFDTFVRHKLPIIAVVGNDACWMQIARDQETILGDLVGCELARTDYHRVVEGFGAKGFVVDDIKDAPRILREAKATAKRGVPVLINVHIGKSDFRKGSMSI